MLVSDSMANSKAYTFEIIDEESDPIDPLCKLLLWDRQTIYSVKSKKSLYNYGHKIQSWGRSDYYRGISDHEICFMEVNNSVLIFSYKLILIYELSTDSIRQFKRFSAPYSVQIGKYYFIIFYDNRSFVYAKETFTLCQTISEMRIIELSEHLFLAYNNDIISVRRKDNMLHSIFEYRLPDNYCKLPPIVLGASITLIPKDGELVNCIIVSGISQIKKLKILIKEKDIIDELKLCCICMLVPEYKITLDPCGHTKYCMECATKLDRCSICRSPITKVIRLFE